MAADQIAVMRALGHERFRCSAMIEAAESHTGWLSTIPLQ